MSSSKKKKKRREDESTKLNLMDDDIENGFARALDSGFPVIRVTGFQTNQDSSASKPYTIFAVLVQTLSETWTVYRRYNEFATVAASIGKSEVFSSLCPKTPFGGNFAADFLNRRQGQLQLFLDKAFADPSAVNVPEVRDFLVLGANLVPSTAPSSANLTPRGSTGSSQPKTPPKDILQDMQDMDVDDDMAVEPVPVPVKELAPPPLPPLHVAKQRAETKISAKDFDMIQVLGKGSFGKVVLASKRSGRDGGHLYAIKILNKQNVVKKNQVEHTLTERSVLGRMNHPFIVKLHYAFQTDSQLHFVLDYCAGGELFFHLGRAGCFSEDLGRFYAAEITLALGHLHEHGIVYRDLKPENILLTAEGHVKLADFGLSKEGVTHGTEGSHSFCGTPEYLAPEVLDRSGHGTAVDWWSLGALLYEMLTGLPPWFTQDRQKLFAAIRHAPLRLPAGLSAASKLVLTELLQRAPAERLGAHSTEEVKRQPFFASIDWVALYELRVLPPFVPKLSSRTDTTNFETNFTRLPLDSVAAGAMHHTVTTAQVSDRVNVSTFGGFTFQDQHELAWTPPPTGHFAKKSPNRTLSGTAESWKMSSSFRAASPSISPLSSPIAFADDGF